MAEQVALELIFVMESTDSIFVRDEEYAPFMRINKGHVAFDEDVLQPGKIQIFELDESIAIDLGFV